MVFSEIGCTPENIVKKKGERNMRKKILKIMKWAGLILLGAAAALMVWNFICRQAERSKIQAAYGTVIEVRGHVKGFQGYYHRAVWIWAFRQGWDGA